MYPGRLLVLAVALVLVQPAQAAGKSEFLFFYGLEDLQRGKVDDATLQQNDFTPSADLLYSYTNGRWRVLAEYFVTDDENELERLQVGYSLGEDTTLWFGRFHQPLSFWNFQFHHGAYLQPSIARPAIEEWEDDGGVLPAHVTGLMLDTLRPAGDAHGLRLVGSIGIAPRLTAEQLEPFNILDPDDSDFRPSVTLGVSWYPDIVGESNVGIVVSHAQILPVPNSTLGMQDIRIDQTVANAHLAWDSAAWSVVSAVYYVNNDSEDADIDGWFVSGYLQANLTLTGNTSAYARIEDSSHAESSGYLALFPEFIQSKALLGFRWDFATRQALSLELGPAETAADRFNEIRLQWSGVLP
jgi:hypothetical protein